MKREEVGSCLILVLCATLLGCQSLSPAIPRQTVYYIPRDASGTPITSLATVSSTDDVGPGGLAYVDGIEVWGKLPALVYLTPGDHMFKYYAYWKIDNMTVLSISEKSVKVEAGKSYLWREILRQIDPATFADAIAVDANTSGTVSVLKWSEPHEPSK